MAFCTLALLCSCNDATKADSLVIGNVITMDPLVPQARAVAIRNGKIIFVGSEEEAGRLCGNRTVVHNFGSASIYPGFMDGHAHGELAISRFNEADLFEVDEREGSAMEDFVEAMRQYMEDHPGQEEYKGQGWTVKDKEPDASMLDAICPDVPMVLTSADLHSVWINTAAMEKYGIDSEAAAEYGSDCIRLDAEGKPTGYVSEKIASSLMGDKKMGREDFKKGLLKWQDYAFSRGITAVSEASLNADEREIIEAYRELCDEGLWKLRTYAYVRINENVPNAGLDSALNRVLEMSRELEGEYFRISGAKVFMDGVLESHTAWLDEEYSDQSGYYGLALCTESDRVARIVSFCNTHGMNVHFHAIGDAASRVAVEGISKAADATGINDGRNTIAHLQLVHQELIAKFAEYNIIAVVAPLWIPKYPYEYDITCQYIGDRALTQYPVKSFFDAGCKVNFHSDFPVTYISVPQNIYTAVTRELADSGEESRHNYPEHISRRQALEAATIHTAYQWKEENNLGSLSTGKIANMAVFDTDFLNDDLQDVWDAGLLATFVDGEIVYSADPADGRN